ncbi:uncharacterized protein G2W53_037736 [Senna tora]|uniref:Uncharacterized protein n=1 Tax=Senna tora TaxID=362788 RepID=A0A834SN37_9FABA|nr:uncharacterized protein G2W53_037736 [Senna tora]
MNVGVPGREDRCRISDIEPPHDWPGSMVASEHDGGDRRVQRRAF